MDKLNSPDTVSKIGSDLIIRGNIEGKGDLELAGVIEGEIYLMSGKLTIEPKGSVEGNVHVSEISVSGEVKGSIEATSKVAIASTGKIRGDVRTTRIDISEGAFLCGNFIVEDQGRSHVQ